VIGRSYTWRGEVWTVLRRWTGTGGPRNVLIENARGKRIVRPFRGLRRLREDGE
jgi:hypothetical protein